MAIVSTAGDLSRKGARAITSPDFNPIHIWAFFGLAFIALNIYVYSMWITGPYFITVPIGADVPPWWMIATARFLEFFSPTCFVIVAYRVIYRPWRRTGELSNDALIVLACLTFNWQNNLPNYFVSTAALLNSTFTNWGSWYMYVPGWISPNMQNMPEAPLAWFFCYATFFVFGPMLLGAKIMRSMKGRFPYLSAWQMFCCIWLFFMLWDFVLEGLFLRLGFYAYATAYAPLTLWAGKPYQFPFYEVVGWGLALTCYASSYYYRDDKGYTWIERGVQRLKVSKPVQKILRILALTAGLNFAMLILSDIPIAFGALFGGPMVQGYPSYLNTKLCGPDTAYDCPGPEVLIPRQGTPTNRLARPAS
ncbi:MAG: hypothetical protein JWQ90_2109 [Hydrocarboniphaga sp.]|uniref:spirocyclase AveC family protein n=1 Tax=Hydrocarboniphaga sp. TaxID=2033016 RepID=UPI0026184A81|nr:spirocyclase AveC family protein [Hydrocarboniphaga sp.]MDB5969659.1 hypothetical protein [Hydrocarboniphaga sp.]